MALTDTQIYRLARNILRVGPPRLAGRPLLKIRTRYFSGICPTGRRRRERAGQSISCMAARSSRSHLSMAGTENRLALHMWLIPYKLWALSILGRTDVRREAYLGSAWAAVTRTEGRSSGANRRTFRCLLARIMAWNTDASRRCTTRVFRCGTTLTHVPRTLQANQGENDICYS